MPEVHGTQWTRLVGFKRSRGKLAIGPGALGFEHEIMEMCAEERWLHLV